MYGRNTEAFELESPLFDGPARPKDADEQGAPDAEHGATAASAAMAPRPSLRPDTRVTLGDDDRPMDEEEGLGR